MNMNARKKLRADVLKFYLYQGFANFDLVRGIFALYLIDKGLSGQQIGMLQAALFVSSMLLEIPTGYLADRIGQKWAIVLGLVLSSLVLIGQLFAQDFNSFLILFIVLGLGYSLERGADSSMLMERLEVHLKKRSASIFDRVSARAKSVRYVSLAIAVSIGGVLQQLGWPLVYSATALSIVLGAILVWRISNNVRVSANEARLPRGTTLGYAHILAVARDRSFVLLGLGLALSSAVVAPFFVFSQVVFESQGLSPKEVGWILSGSLIANAFGGYSALKFTGRTLFGRIAFPMLVGALLTLGLFFLKGAGYLAVVVVVLSYVMSVASVHLGNALIRVVPRDLRATSLSIVSFACAAFVLISNSALGSIIDRGVISGSLALLAFPLLAALVVARFYRA